METLNSRNAILSAAKKRTKEIDIPDLGRLRIRRLSGMDCARLGDAWKGSESRSTEENEKQIQCKIVQLALVDENGERLYGDSDLDAIGDLDKDILDQVTQEVIAFSGISGAAAAVAEKNSPTIQISARPSTSAVN